MHAAKGKWIADRNRLITISLILAVITIPLHNNLNSWALLVICIFYYHYSKSAYTHPIKGVVAGS
jgi:hypothetical protein